MDEGTLHALLDGALRAEDPARADRVEAHLDVCPDCRALRDEAAAIRDDAAVVLGALATDARPDFQEVLVRAGRGEFVPAQAPAHDPSRQERLRRQVRTTRTLAWAATVVLALGTGYLVRDRLGPDRPGMAPATMSAERVADRADGAPADRAPTGEQTSEAARADQPAPEQTPGARARTGERETAGAPRVADATRPQGMETTLPRGGETGPPPPGREVTVATEEPASLQVPEPSPRPGTEAPRSERLETAALPGEPHVMRARPGPPQPARALALESIVVAAASQGITAEEARELLGGPVYVLPGADVASLEVRAAGPEPAIRSIQRMADGLELVVTQRPADLAGRAVAGRAADLRDEVDPAPGTVDETTPAVTVLRGGYVLTITGTLPAEAIRALAEASRPLADEGRTP